MIVLVLSVCLSVGGGCRDVAIPPPDDGAGLLACMISGQRTASHWLAEHPKYALRAWRCGPRQIAM